MANGSNMKHLATPLEKANLKQGTSVMTDYGYDRSEIGRCFPVKLKNVLTIRETSPHGRATPRLFNDISHKACRRFRFFGVLLPDIPPQSEAAAT